LTNDQNGLCGRLTDKSIEPRPDDRRWLARGADVQDDEILSTRIGLASDRPGVVRQAVLDYAGYTG